MDRRRRIGEILVEGTRATMETLGRNATGKASDSLRIEVVPDGVNVYGVDYFKEIDEGTPPGTVVDLSNLVEWVAAKLGQRGRRGVRIAYAVRRNIEERGAPKDQSKLGVLSKTFQAVRRDIEDQIDLQASEILTNNISKALA